MKIETKIETSKFINKKYKENETTPKEEKKRKGRRVVEGRGPKTHSPWSVPIHRSLNWSSVSPPSFNFPFQYIFKVKAKAFI